MRRSLFAAIGFAILMLQTNALADSDPEQLFKEGSALMEQGKFNEALPMLERAQKLDPGIGTLFNIGVCHQKLGRLGTAYREFREVANLAKVSGKKVREDAARAKIEELKTEAPAFTIVSQEKGEVTVKIDGASVMKDDWAFYPVDPGDHKVEATAPSKRPWATSVSTPAPGKVDTITVPALQTETVTVTTETTDTRRTLGYIFGGLGVAGAVTAGITGVMLLNDHSTAEENCTVQDSQSNKLRCRDAAGSDAVSRGRTLLPINAVAWGVAAVGIGAGIFFLATAGKKSEPKSAARFVPSVGPTGGGATVVGSF